MPIPKNIQNTIKKNSPETEKIILANLGLNDEDIYTLADLLEDNDYIRSLDLSGNNITADGAMTLATLRLDELDVRDNKLGNKGAKFLCGSHTLKNIKLTGNGVSDEVLASLGSKQNYDLKFLEQLKTLKFDDKNLIKMSNEIDKTSVTTSELASMNKIAALSEEIIKTFQLQQLNDTSKFELINTLVQAMLPEEKKSEDKFLTNNSPKELKI